MELTLELWRLTLELWRLTLELWRLTLELWRLTLELWRLTLELCRFTQESWSSPRAMEAHNGVYSYNKAIFVFFSSTSGKSMKRRLLFGG
jgi:hypothetical protein